MSAMEGGSPSKVEVDGMIHQFMGDRIDEKIDAYWRTKQAELEESVGKILKKQTETS